MLKIWHRSVGSLPKWLQIVVACFAIGIPVAIIGLITLDLLGLTRQPAPPPHKGSVATMGTACPGMDSEWRIAADQIRTIGGWGAQGPTVQEAACHDSPKYGEFQIRSVSQPDMDSLKPTRLCYERRACAVLEYGADGRVERGIIYVNDGARFEWCDYRHELMHVAPGLGHTDSPRSIMYGNDAWSAEDASTEGDLRSCYSSEAAWALVTKAAVEGVE